MYFTLSSLALSLVYHMWIHRTNLIEYTHSSSSLLGVVLGVYFLDRYFDNQRSVEKISRKSFAQGVVLGIGMTLSMGFLAYGLWGISERVILQGVVLGGLLIPYFYFFVIHPSTFRLGGWKEVAIALIFGLGVSLPIELQLDSLVEVGTLVWLIFVGLVLISDLDQEVDRVNQMPNLFLTSGFKSYRFTYWVSLILLPLWWWFDILWEPLFTLILLELIYVLRSYLKGEETMHILVDVALLLPFLVGVIL